MPCGAWGWAACWPQREMLCAWRWEKENSAAFAAGTSAGGLARWYMSAAVLLGALCWHWAVQPAVHRAASMLAVLLLGPLHAAHKMLLQPLQDRAAQARTVRKSRKTAKKSRKTQNSAEKQLQKPSIILYN